MTVLDGALRSKALYKILGLLGTSAFMSCAYNLCTHYPSKISKLGLRELISLNYSNFLQVAYIDKHCWGFDNSQVNCFSDFNSINRVVVR